MPDTPTYNSFYPELSADEQERALFNLDQYFEIVLQIFLRLQANPQDTHSN